MLAGGFAVSIRRRPGRGPRRAGRDRHAWAGLLCLGLLLPAPAPRAAMPDMDWIDQAELVPDHELADMRGRFVLGGDVTYFGVQMVSTWQTSDGMVMNTGVEWGVDLGGGSTDPTVSFFQISPDDTASSIDPLLERQLLQEAMVIVNEPVPLTPTAGAGGLETATGIVQSVQAAGDDNDIGNDIGLAVVNGDAAPSLAFPQTTLGAPHGLTGTTTVEFAAGSKATAFVDDNAIGMVLSVPGAGVVLQELRGAQGRAAQHANINGSLNFVRNTMQITFGVDATDQPLGANVRSALQLLPGLR